MQAFTRVFATFGIAMLITLVGCKPASSKKGKVPNMPPDTVPMHPTEGPHHGHLIELGQDHKYHAELIHDEKKNSVTIYVLGPIEDGVVKRQVPIKAEEIVINLKHDGKAEQFKLKAVPDKNDPMGQSSRFVSEDQELSHDLDHGETDARLVLTIGGTSYTGKIEHDHDHDHEHKHKE